MTDKSDLNNFLISFIFQSASEINGVPFWGYMNTYDGGGYVANFGNTEDEALDLVNLLRKSNWIDQYTKAIFLEFNVWNANTNLFNLLTLVLEFPNTGSMFHWNRISSVQLYRYNAASGVIALFAEIGLIIFVLVMAVFEGKKIYREKRSYFSNMWNIIQLILLLLFWAACVCYILRSLKTKSTVEEMMNNRGRFQY